jgi:uncharacterized protein (TIGR02265 family)
MTAPETRVVFASSMEGLWRGLAPANAEELAAFAKAGVVGPTPRFLAAYPVEAYSEVMDTCARTRFGHLGELERYTEVGRLFVSGYSKTMVGSALLALLRVLGPRRTLERTTRNIRTANSYTEASLETLAPNHHRLRVNYVAHPGFYRGIIEGTCLHAGAKELRVDLAEFTDNAPIYDVRWA